MSYFAAAVVRDAGAWSASLFSLSGAADIEDVADRLRDLAPDAELSLLFIESDDVYLVVVRLDQGDDLRVFGSDGAFAEESRLGKVLLGDIEDPAIDLDEAIVLEPVDEPEISPPPSEADPVGDADLLVDLGVSAARLRELCGQEGMLPSDITAELCQAIGCGDEVEELREA